MKKFKQVFKFKPFSKKQRKVLNWWTKTSPVKDADGIIADGAIRSGKTVSMALSFVMWAMENFNGQNLGMCGKTVGSFRRNVWFWLKIMLISRGYKYKDHKTENYIEITRKGKLNYFYIFGGKDEASQDLIQGITLAGIFFDEVALMPESFVNQGTGRCSVDGSKFWFNCNPDGPMHWFKVNWIDKSTGYLSKEQQKELVSKDIVLKNILYLHFTMDDNLSLSEKVKQRYRSTYVGVFFKRYVLGLWVMAEGAIYDMWSEEENEITADQVPQGYKYTMDHYISIDYGTTNPTDYLDIWDDGDTIWITKEYYYDSKEKGRQKEDAEYADDYEKFVGDDTPIFTIVDPSAASFKTALINRDYIVKDADNEVSDGIRMTSTMIAQRKIKIVKEACPRTIKDIKSYVWDEKAAKLGEEKPLKVNDHGADALRYFVKTIIKQWRLTG